jgi:hypothetical protein
LVDLRNLIIISSKDVICHFYFYNIQELKYCPYTIRKSIHRIETVIHLSRENFIINCNDKRLPVKVPDYLNISEKNYEKSFIDYTDEELSVQMKKCYHL